MHSWIRYCSCPRFKYSFWKVPHWLMQCPSSKMKFKICFVKLAFLKSFSTSLLPMRISGWTITMWYLPFSMSYTYCEYLSMTMWLSPAPAHALVTEPNVRVNQGFWGSLTTVLPVAPSWAWALPSICLYIDSLYNTSNHAVLIWRLLWSKASSWF